MHIVEFLDGTTAAVGVLRAGVEHEALASVDALEGSVQLGSVVQKLARLMFREFDLFQEGETLIEFAATPIGQHPMFDVVPVRHHSPRCLVEGVAVGRSIPKALADPNTREDVRDTLTGERNKICCFCLRFVLSQWVYTNGRLNALARSLHWSLRLYQMKGWICPHSRVHPIGLSDCVRPLYQKNFVHEQ